MRRHKMPDKISTNPALQAAFDSDYEAMALTLARRDRLDAAIADMAEDSPYTPIVRRLGCLRGVSTLTAFGLAVEIGDRHRFTANTIGAYIGLVPSEYSSGTSRSQGSITKTGNGHARRLLVEAAWHHRKTYRNPGQVMHRRWERRLPGRGHEDAQATTDSTTNGNSSPPAKSVRRLQMAPSRASSQDGAGPSPRSRTGSQFPVIWSTRHRW